MPSKSTKLLSQVDYRLGSLFAIVDPTMWTKVTHKFVFKDDKNREEFVRSSVLHDLCRSTVAGRLTAVKQLAGGRRIIAVADTVRKQARICLGQRVPLLDIQNRGGLKAAELAPEVQLGVDLLTFAPSVSVLLSDDDYKGIRAKPLTHPSVLVTGAVLYSAMHRYRFPLAATVTAARFNVADNARVELQLSTRTQRQGKNRLNTVTMTGAMLALHV